MNANSAYTDTVNTRTASRAICRRIRPAGCVLAALLIILAAAVYAPAYYAAGEEEVSSHEQFISALLDESVHTININSDLVPVIQLSGTYQISRTLTINGRGAALSAVDGGQLSVNTGVSLTLGNMTLSGSENYAVASNGTVILGDSAVIGGRFGILLKNGAILTSGGHVISVAETVSRAVAVNTGGGNVTLYDLLLEQQLGDTDMLYIVGSDGKLTLNNNITVKTSGGNAFMCPTGESCPNVTVGSGAVVELSAENAANSAGDGSTGAAMDIRNGNITFERNVTAVISGSTNGIIANNIKLENGVSVKIKCRSAGGSASSGTSNAAIWAGGAVTLGNDVTLDMLETPLPCNGMYIGKGLETGTGCSIQICGNGGQYSAVCTPQSVILGDNTTLLARSVGNAIICDHGMTTGRRTTLSLTDIRDYGIYSTGTMQADKLYFDEENTITINAGKCSIYTRESVDIKKGSLVELSSTNRAPALWIDAETSSQGHLNINNSTVNVKCAASSQAVHNSGIYVVGATTVDEGSVLTVLNNGDFGAITTYGDINVSNDSSFYASGGCGIYILHGNMRLTQGGRLYAEGLIDSGVRVEHGVLNAGEKTVMDIQGSRFGAEILGDGGVWITDVDDYDIRSTTDRAVYIQNGTLNISGVDRVSAWLKSGRDNSVKWWNTDVSGYRSWEIRQRVDTSEMYFADYTMLSPNGAQEYKEGSAQNHTGFSWYNGTWMADEYARLGMFLSRPTARSNNFYIPQGRSFSWWLNGESYTDGELVFKITSPVENDSVTLGSNGRFTFRANNMELGIQEFKYVVIDSEGISSEEATISVNVTASKPPIVSSGTFFTGVSENIIGQLEMYDYDGRISMTEVAAKPSHGEIIVSSDGQFSYTPEVAFTGIDTFAYYAVDNMNDKSNIGYIAIVVGDITAPVAPYSTLITESNVPISMRFSPITAGDISEEEYPGENASEDPDAEQEAPPPVTYYYEITRQPVYGQLSFTAADTVEYNPYEDFSGSDIFCYRITGSDGSVSNEALVTIATIPNQRPYAEPNSYICVSGSKRSGKLSAEDVDGSIVSYRIVQEPESGKLELNDSNGEFVYKAPFGYTGQVVFKYTVKDNDGLESHETAITIEVLSLADYLRSTGKMKMALVAGICIIISLIVIVALLISWAANRRKEKKLQEQREKILGGLYIDGGVNNGSRDSDKK